MAKNRARKINNPTKEELRWGFSRTNLTSSQRQRENHSKRERERYAEKRSTNVMMSKQFKMGTLVELNELIYRKTKYTKRQIEKADLAHRIRERMGWPSTATIKKIINTGGVLSAHTSKDVDHDLSSQMEVLFQRLQLFNHSLDEFTSSY